MERLAQNNLVVHQNGRGTKKPMRRQHQQGFQINGDWVDYGIVVWCDFASPRPERGLMRGRSIGSAQKLAMMQPSPLMFV